MAKQKARVLVDATIDGTAYKANDVVEAEDKVIAGAEKEGTVDANPAAVKYAEGLRAKSKADAEV